MALLFFIYFFPISYDGIIISSLFFPSFPHFLCFFFTAT